MAIARRLAIRLYWVLRTRHNCAQMVYMSGSPSSAVVPPEAPPLNFRELRPNLYSESL